MNRLLRWLKHPNRISSPTGDSATSPAVSVERFSSHSEYLANCTVEMLRRYGDNVIDVHHVLLALLEKPNNIILDGLDQMKVDVEMLYAELDKATRQVRSLAAYASADAQFVTPRVKQVIVAAQKEATRLSSSMVEPEHLFLGALLAPDSLSSEILWKYDLTWARMNQALLDTRPGP